MSGLISRASFRKKPIDLEERVAAEIEADEIAKFSILSHHHGLETVDVRPPDLVLLLDLDGIPIPGIGATP